MRYSIGDFAVIAYVLCVIHGASETSGHRTHLRNNIVGGASQSRHQSMNGDENWCGAKARDLALDDNTEENRQALVRDAQALGLYALDEGDHVHIHDQP